MRSLTGIGYVLFLTGVAVLLAAVTWKMVTTQRDARKFEGSVEFCLDDERTLRNTECLNMVLALVNQCGEGVETVACKVLARKTDLVCRRPKGACFVHVFP